MRDGKRVVVTYGTYDLLHRGHVALLERARELGDYLIVGVTSDAFDRQRGKLNVHQPLLERVHAVESTGLADEIVIEEYRGQKISDIQRLGVDVFTVGSDWEGKFDYLQKYCDVVYLERTKGVSSTELRAEREPSVALGCIGLNYLTERLVRESRSVGGIDIVCAFEEGCAQTDELCEQLDIEAKHSAQEVFSACDAVYIARPIDERAALIDAALEAGCHVLCETPLFLSEHEALALFDKAERNGLVLMEALKTRYFPAFEHLKLLLESGAVGDIKDIDASFSHVFSSLDRSDKYEGSFYDMASYILLPAMAFLGDSYTQALLVGSFDEDFCVWAKCDLLYPSACATLRVGRGIKTEGDMVITGTDGYVYVPAPW
ncbi:MAG: adenylyltransferase/cytidyltransferase family protein, partial [Raoultibacter sp.]